MNSNSNTQNSVEDAEERQVALPGNVPENEGVERREIVLQGNVRPENEDVEGGEIAIPPPPYDHRLEARGRSRVRRREPRRLEPRRLEARLRYLARVNNRFMARHLEDQEHIEALEHELEHNPQIVERPTLALYIECPLTSLILTTVFFLMCFSLFIAAGGTVQYTSGSFKLVIMNFTIFSYEYSSLTVGVLDVYRTRWW